MPLKIDGDDSDDDNQLRRDDSYDPRAAHLNQTILDVECVTQEDLLKQKRQAYRREYQREYRKRKRDKKTGKLMILKTRLDLYSCDL